MTPHIGISGKQTADDPLIFCRFLSKQTRPPLFTSPVTKANVAKGALPVRDLLQAMMQLSDNTAAILLMRRAGGPESLTRFLRGVGDRVTRSDRYEPDSNDYSGDLDTTSPRAVIETARKILLGDVLTPASRERIEGWMVECRPGLDRIRAVLPADWRAGDRPGTSEARETNDVALVRPPGRAPLLIAAYYDAPGLDFDRREAVLRDVGKAFVEWARS
jgi:beta-lactamase class A